MTKRTAENQLTKDNVDDSVSEKDEDAPEAREKASEQVMATRKIVSVRRGTSSQPNKPQTISPKNSNDQPSDVKPQTGLFAGLVGLSSIAQSDAQSEEKPSLFLGLSSLASESSEQKGPKDESEGTSGGLFSSLFTPIGEGSNSFATFSFSAPSGTAAESSSFPSFGGAAGDTPEDTGEPSEQEEEPPVPASAIIVDHDAEIEDMLYQNDCKLFKLQKVDSDTMKWNEKGIGFVRLIQNKESKGVRIVVRMKGVYRLMLNAGLVDSLSRAEKVGNKSVKFSAVEDGSISDFRVNMLTEDQQAAFMDKLPDSLKNE